MISSSSLLLSISERHLVAVASLLSPHQWHCITIQAAAAVTRLDAIPFQFFSSYILTVTGVIEAGMEITLGARSCDHRENRLVHVLQPAIAPTTSLWRSSQILLLVITDLEAVRYVACRETVEGRGLLLHLSGCLWLLEFSLGRHRASWKEKRVRQVTWCGQVTYQASVTCTPRC